MSYSAFSRAAHCTPRRFPLAQPIRVHALGRHEPRGPRDRHQRPLGRQPIQPAAHAPAVARGDDDSAATAAGRGARLPKTRRRRRRRGQESRCASRLATLSRTPFRRRFSPRCARWSTRSAWSSSSRPRRLPCPSPTCRRCTPSCSSAAACCSRATLCRPATRRQPGGVSRVSLLSDSAPSPLRSKWCPRTLPPSAPSLPTRRSPSPRPPPPSGRCSTRRRSCTAHTARAPRLGAAAAAAHLRGGGDGGRESPGRAWRRGLPHRASPPLPQVLQPSPAHFTPVRTESLRAVPLPGRVPEPSRKLPA